MKKKPKLLSNAKTRKRLSAFVSDKPEPEKERQMIYIEEELRQQVHVWATERKRSFSDVATTALREYLAKEG